MSKYWSDFVHRLVPYVPGEQPKIANLVKLNTNENPYAPSPKAIAAMRGELGDNLRRYPDPASGALVDAIAAFHGVPREYVFVGNGSDEVLGHVFLGLLKHPRPILFPDITYSFYPVYCGLYGIAFETLPLDESFRVRLADYARPNGGIVIPNPNAPTGIALTLSEVEKLVAGNPDSVVVVDEAYVDFGADSAVALTKKYPNLLVTQTLSKSRSLAGLRVGFAIGQPELVEALVRVKDSFNSYPLDRMAIAGGAAAMADREYFEETRQAVIASRETLVAELAALGFEVLPSAANFVFARHRQRDGAELAQALRERAVLVRHFRKPERIAPFLRITIGLPEENAALVAALRDILR
ncbi:MAG: histidinol-phosphate transaminase [Gammaproteobacteria bacterium]